MQSYDRRFEDILDSTEDLFAEKGFHATSMRDIAHAADMSIAGLYYYLPSKQAALFFVCTRIFDRLDAAADELRDIADPEERLRTFVRTHLAYMLRNEDAYRVLLHDMDALDGEYGDRMRLRKRRYFSLAADLVSRLDVNPAFISPRIAAGALFGMLNWAPTWYRRGLDGDIGTVADNILALFLGGISATASPLEVR
ncbi:MAG TPA: TetR/AcrR family transcriptional regulator [Candidatus Dormibacteraeota bacterium]|nr:TetR/AcrR family transcriptional regulator [Candidatus Dormibacteraeota bacterium]